MFKYVIAIFLCLLLVTLLLRWYTGTHKAYQDAITDEVKRVLVSDELLIKDSDLIHLPLQLQEYLRKVGVIGTPRVKYFKVSMTGNMKLDQDKDFSPVKAEQYTFIDSGRRLFYMTMNYNGLQINGLHDYQSDSASMTIKLLDLVTVVDESGDDMKKAETVTYFNDLCIMAPSALLEEDIDWEVLDDSRVRGTLHKHGQSVSAILYFNDDGMIENFVSTDRIEVSASGSKASKAWSTPMSNFDQVGDFYLANQGEAIWHYEESTFAYIELFIHAVTVNK